MIGDACDFRCVWYYLCFVMQILVSSVQQVATRTAVFCIVCCSDYMVETYSSIRFVPVFYFESDVSLCVSYL